MMIDRPQRHHYPGSVHMWLLLDTPHTTDDLPVIYFTSTLWDLEGTFSRLEVRIHGSGTLSPTPDWLARCCT